MIGTSRPPTSQTAQQLAWDLGTLTAEKVEIRASASVRATIKARTVAIADGALYEGGVQMLDAASAPTLFQERRTGGNEP